MDRAFELQVLAELADLRRRVERLEKPSKGGRGVREGFGKEGATSRKIVLDLEVALGASIPERSMAGVIARKTGFSDRHVRRLRNAK